MLADSALTMLIALASVLVAVAVATLGGVIRMSLRWGVMETKLTVMAETLQSYRSDSDRAHDAIYSALRDDRNATDRRLHRLEGVVMAPSAARPDTRMADGDS